MGKLKFLLSSKVMLALGLVDIADSI
jgi:hypothetical protein